ncbi:Profilin/allergen [Apiospora phragmitis]|uniref:Profilin n=1 Tax=Apiospora phragmitis TaxID=2905665 RepID=A0ABR1X645_9PEZI
MLLNPNQDNPALARAPNQLDADFFPLVKSGHIDKAAIISVAGDSVWASSAGFTLKPEEMKNIANIVTNAPGAVDKALAGGLTLAGRTGILAVKTTQAILVGHYGEGVQAGNAAQTVEALADYLIKVGY